MKKILRTPIPLYIVTLSIAVVVIGVFYIVSRFGPQPYQVNLGNAQGGDVEDLEFGSWPALSNADFFRQVRDDFIEQKSDFIEADLSLMRLRVWQQGTTTLEVPILTKGREGSWWETPAGLYEIQSREKNHFSSFGSVYQPWSMAFQGNFFIHGWPYHPDGSEVSSTYSGGCIRLSTEDAKKVYDLTKMGMPVLVFEKDFAQDDFTYQRASAARLSAKSYLAADLKNNFVFIESNSAEQLPVASITKLMTALVAVEYVNIEKEITVTPSMIVPTSVPRLKAGERVSLYNLLYILLEESSNEAAEAISRFLGRDRFITLMNDKAKAIGMTSSKFTDPSGADAGNVSTAQDLFNLAKYLYNNRSFVLKLSSGRPDSLTVTVYGPTIYDNIENFNIFENDREFIGGKVGKTNAAGQTIISIFETQLSGAKRPVVVIALGSQSNAADAQQLISWIRSSYR